MVLAIWGIGVCGMLTILVVRQLSFVKSLGSLSPASHSTRRSTAVVAPVLVGAFNPTLILPADFESRYSVIERQMIIDHERAHLMRGDVTVNAIAAGWLCLFWFNPLMYWAVGRLRLDQELACDAIVLAGAGVARRSYADALLKTQLDDQSDWLVPVGSHWQSSHPLKERIAMIKRSVPRRSRRYFGIASALVLTVAGSYAAWAAQSESAASGPQILVDVSLNVHEPQAGNPKATHIFAASTQYLVYSGEAVDFLGRPAKGFMPRCTATVPDRTVGAKAHIVTGIADGQLILLTCEILHNGKVDMTHYLIAQDGQPLVVDTDDRAGAFHYRLEVNATASPEKIVQRVEAAKAAATKR
jgi:hypothetical protein